MGQAWTCRSGSSFLGSPHSSRSTYIARPALEGLVVASVDALWLATILAGLLGKARLSSGSCLHCGFLKSVSRICSRSRIRGGTSRGTSRVGWPCHLAGIRHCAPGAPLAYTTGVSHQPQRPDGALRQSLHVANWLRGPWHCCCCSRQSWRRRASHASPESHLVALSLHLDMTKTWKVWPFMAFATDAGSHHLPRRRQRQVSVSGLGSHGS